MGGTVFQKPYAHLHINRIRFYSFSKNEPTRISHTHTHAKKKNSLQPDSNDIDDIPK